MKQILKYILLSAILCQTFFLQGQSTNYSGIIELIENRQYQLALDGLNQINSKDREYYFLRGVTLYHQGNLDVAIDHLTQSYRLGSKRPELMKYIAQSHLKKEEYLEASRAYKLYLNELTPSDPERQEIINSIKRCAYGIKAKYLERQGFVENMGEPVNSKFDEIAPFVHIREDNKLYFSSNRYDENQNTEKLIPSFNILIWDLLKGRFHSDDDISPLINTEENEILQGLNDDASKLIFLRNTPDRKSQLYREDVFSLYDYVSKPILITEFIKPEQGDRDLFFLSDSMILFSSNREGGYGGFDLYIVYKKEGQWQEPLNLGPEVNSPFDERTPFLTKSGTALFFSSNRLESLGGFDIYTTSFGLESGRWLPVENLGYPISSPGDDLFFRLLPDGRSAVFTSDRKESIGGFDMFTAYLKTPVLEHLSYGEAPFIHTRPQEKITDEMVELPPFTARELAVEPLSFGNDNIVMTSKNTELLDQVIEYMKLYPDLLLTLTGHTISEGNKSYDLFFSIKKSEEAAEYIISKDIHPNRVHIIGLGSFYPMIKNANSTLASRHDKRIELYFNDLKVQGLNIINNIPYISDNFRDRKYDEYMNARTGVTFAVDMIKVRQIFDHPVVQFNENIMIRKPANDDQYTYFLGLIPTYEEAKHVESVLQKEGFDETGIQVFIDGKMISQNRVLELYEKYPVLKNYIFGEILKDK